VTASDADPEEVREQLLRIYDGVRQGQRRPARPFARMIKEWAAAHRDEDLKATLTAL